jgi:hypothetical protein
MTKEVYAFKTSVGGCLCAQEQTRNVQGETLNSQHLGCILFRHTEVRVGTDPNWPQQWVTWARRVSAGEVRVRTRDGRNECF